MDPTIKVTIPTSLFLLEFIENVPIKLYSCEVNSLPEYIAYQGDVYQIEFYFDAKGKSQSRKYLEDMDGADARKFAHLLQMMGDIGQIRNKQKFRNEGNKVYAFKPQPHRFLCFFFSGNKIIITNAFMKKQQKLPKPEKDRALQCKEDYEKRVKERKYYGQEY